MAITSARHWTATGCGRRVTKSTTTVLWSWRSEAGVISLDEEDVAVKGRLGPGEVIAIDTLERRLLDNDAIKRQVAGRQPYARMVPAGKSSHCRITRRRLLFTRVRSLLTT